MNNITHKLVSGVYCITNKTNNKIYVGSSKNVYYRIARHKSDLLKNKHWNSHLQSSVNKYGIANFEVTLIKECSDFVVWEQFYIDYWKPEYNKNMSASTTILKQSSRNKISVTLKRKFAEGLKKTRVRPIDMCDCSSNYVASFETIQLAAEYIGTIASSIRKCLYGEYAQHKNYTFTDKGNPCPNPVVLNSMGIKRKNASLKFR